MVMIGRAIFSKAGDTLETETILNVADWERQRECLKLNPDWFDVDAPIQYHVRAKTEGCDRCPVIGQCRSDRVLNNPGASGVYAGMVFTQHAGEAPYEIGEYHRTHKVGGMYRNGTSDQPRFDKDWSEERECAAKGIGCTEKFTVTPQNHSKKFHDKACRLRYNRLLGPALADAS